MFKIKVRGWLPWLAVVSFLSGMAWRIAYILGTHRLENYLYSDMKSYASQMVKYYDSSISPDRGDTIYPPGTAYLFGFVYHLIHSWWTIDILMLLFSVFIPLLVAAIGYTLFNRRVALLGLIIASLYPGFIIYSGFLLSEIPATFFMLLSFWLLALAIKNRETNRQLYLALAAGLAFGTVLSIRSQLFLSGIFIGFCLAIFYRHNKRTLMVLLAASCTTVLFVVPLTVRCSQLDKQLCVISTNGALGILQGHYGDVGHFNFQDYEHGTHYSFGNATTLQQGNGDYVNLAFGPYDQRAVEREAFKWISQNPLQSTWLSIKHIRDLFWGSVPWPQANTGDRSMIIFSEWIFKLFVLLPAGIYAFKLSSAGFRSRVKNYKYDILLLMPIAGIILTVFITVAEPRYRIPLDGFFILLAIRAYSYWFDTRHI